MMLMLLMMMMVMMMMDWASASGASSIAASRRQVSASVMTEWQIRVAALQFFQRTRTFVYNPINVLRHITAQGRCCCLRD